MRLPIIKRYTAVGKVATDGNILVPVNALQIAFLLSAGILLSSDADVTAAATLLFTYDDMSADWQLPVTVSQTTTVITVTDPNLPAKGGISAAVTGAPGDVVRIVGTGIAGLDGEWPVATTPTPTSYTLTSSVNQSAVSSNAKAAVFHMFSSGVKNTAGQRGFGNLSAGIAVSPAFNSGAVSAVALNVTALATGSIYLQLLQAMGR